MIANSHAQLHHNLNKFGIPIDIRISSEAPIQYTKADYLPERLLDAGTALPPGSYTGALQACGIRLSNPAFYRNPMGDPGMFGRFGSMFNFSPKESMGPGGPKLAESFVQESYDNMNNMLDEWFTIIVEKDGRLNQMMDIDAEQLLKLLDVLETDVIPSMKTVKKVSMHGTAKPKGYDIGSPAKPSFASEVPSEFLDVADKTDEFWEEVLSSFRRDVQPDLQTVDNFLDDFMIRKPENQQNGGFLLEQQQFAIRGEYGDDGLEFFNKRYKQYTDWLRSNPRKWIDMRYLKKNLLTRSAQREVGEFRGLPSPEDVDILAPGYFASTTNPYTQNWQNNPGILGRLINGSNSHTYSDLHQIKGAVQQVGDIMVDYSTQTNLDQLMKMVFPFWVFPTRSLKFWGEQLATNPKLLATYNKVQDMSARVSYDVGNVNSYGRPLARFKNHFNLGGTNWWYNPTSPLSVSQAVPDWRSVSYKAPDPEEPIVNKLATYLVAYGPRIGFHLAPWITKPLRAFGAISEEDFPERSLFGQMDFVPEWVQRDIRTKADGTLRMNFEHDLFTPEVTWKDFLIERQVLLTALEQIDGVPEGDRATREQIALAAKHAIETRPDADVNNYMKGTEEFHKEDSLWVAARKKLEKDEYLREAQHITKTRG